MKKSNKPKREPLSRVWFLGHGFHQVPPTEYIDFKILYAHESDLRFVGQYGQELAPVFAQANRINPSNHGHGVPFMRHFSSRKCHILRALAFFGERPTYVTKKGTIRPCEVHHLNGDLEDHRKPNLIAWLDGSLHRIANDRQDTMQTVVPNGDLRGFDYDILRELQDPRTMSDADFNTRMDYLRVMHECHFDPRIFSAAQFHEFFATPFDDFRKTMFHHKNDD